MVLPMTTPRYIPAAEYLARRRTSNLPEPPENPEARVSRCGECGAWTWDTLCRLHPTADRATY